MIVCINYWFVSKKALLINNVPTIKQHHVFMPPIESFCLTQSDGVYEPVAAWKIKQKPL